MKDGLLDLKVRPHTLLDCSPPIRKLQPKPLAGPVYLELGKWSGKYGGLSGKGVATRGKGVATREEHREG